MQRGPACRLPPSRGGRRDGRLRPPLRSEPSLQRAGTPAQGARHMPPHRPCAGGTLAMRRRAVWPAGRQNGVHRRPHGHSGGSSRSELRRRPQTPAPHAVARQCIAPAPSHRSPRALRHPPGARGRGGRGPGLSEALRARWRAPQPRPHARGLDTPAQRRPWQGNSAYTAAASPAATVPLAGGRRWPHAAAAPAAARAGTAGARTALRQSAGQAQGAVAAAAGGARPPQPRACIEQRK